MKRFQFLTWLTCASLLLSGCKTGKSSASDNEDQETGRDVSAAIIGGKAGAAIGRRMQAQKEALEAAFPADDATIETVNRGEALKLTFGAASLFEANSNTLTQMGRLDLHRLAIHLNSNPDVCVKIVGYTDNTGRSAFNRILSTRRAKSVCDLLTAKGVDATRATYEGKGMRHPAASNRTAKGRTVNRRIEIFITPGEEMIREARQEKKQFKDSGTQKK
ncbi:MAG: OmpA family protein [Tannerella sp.]|jgi:outer membrane protein OmpA-like peptidoglycan-associated protein|nr:OmpA family protein [Tannerella sp.]